MWDIRNRGVIPAGALPRVRAFADAMEPTDDDSTDQDSRRGGPMTESDIEALRRAHAVVRREHPAANAGRGLPRIEPCHLQLNGVVGQR